MFQHRPRELSTARPQPSLQWEIISVTRHSVPHLETQARWSSLLLMSLFSKSRRPPLLGEGPVRPSSLPPAGPQPPSTPGRPAPSNRGRRAPGAWGWTPAPRTTVLQWLWALSPPQSSHAERHRTDGGRSMWFPTANATPRAQLKPRWQAHHWKTLQAPGGLCRVSARPLV